METFELIRILEAFLFAASEPIREKELLARLPIPKSMPVAVHGNLDMPTIRALLLELQSQYANRGIVLKRVKITENEYGWAFRTASDLSGYMTVYRQVPKRLSRAAVETLAIIAYHQPITRAEIEEIRGVALSKGTMDILLEATWIKPVGRRHTPGRPITWGTTPEFLDHFGLESTKNLPGIEELRASGLLESRPGLGTIAMQQSEAEDSLDSEEEQEALFNFSEEFDIEGSNEEIS